MSPKADRGLIAALGLTLASTVIWGVAHVRAGRHVAGALLFSVFALLVAFAVIVRVGVRRPDWEQIAVHPDWLFAILIALLVLALVWITVVIRSYQVVSPARLDVLPRAAGVLAVTLLCTAVCTPFVYAAVRTYSLREMLTSISHTSGTSRAEGPWNGRPRVNILLIGSDAAAGRDGTRTDSVTLASIGTRTGDTVLLGLPRNLEHVPLPTGPARERFPDGFTGDGPQTPGLLNEIFQYAEDHPELVPGMPDKQRGPNLLSRTVSGIIAQPVDYYIVIDMFGFADLVDAMGGVKLQITQAIPYGLQGGVLQPGYRTLSGKDALWYGRSRTGSDDYARMARQKCLLRAVAMQADPIKILTKFDALVSAAKRTISTDIPTGRFPELVRLAGKVREGARISSLSFVPPLIYTGDPNYTLIRALAAKAIGDVQRTVTPERSTSASPAAAASPSEGPSAAAVPGPASVSSLQPGGGTPRDMPLDMTCPS
ncbi:MAG: cell envelope-related transcriptional attenuator [Actinomycetia bacterium]|nr:cell envelope-related transcriptional attenuator [Actinomycetes bacterium]